jgi:hypothetical protein
MLPADYRSLDSRPVLSYSSFGLYRGLTDWGYGLHHSIRGPGDGNLGRHNARG